MTFDEWFAEVIVSNQDYSRAHIYLLRIVCKMAWEKGREELKKEDLGS